MDVQLVEGDLTEQRVDAIVNAANSSLLGGGGVDGAIHRKGGPAILAECRDLRASRYGGGLATGQAVATTAGNLPARFVIHTVGPVYESDVDKAPLLRACYTNSLGRRPGPRAGQRRVSADLVRCVRLAGRRRRTPGAHGDRLGPHVHPGCTPRTVWRSDLCHRRAGQG